MRLVRGARAGAGRATGVLRVWLLWEAFYRRWKHIRPVRPGGVLAYDVFRWRGPIVTLADGTRVEPGDRVVNVHLDNVALGRRGEHPARVLAVVREDLRVLAARDDPELRAAKALWGVTVFARVAPLLGMETRPVPRTFANRLARLYMVGLIAIYNRRGWRGIRREERLWQGEVWLSARAWRSAAPRVR